MIILCDEASMSLNHVRILIGVVQCHIDEIFYKHLSFQWGPTIFQDT